MGYKATTKEYVFRVTNKEALLETLNDLISKLRPPEYPYENLEDALEFFCCSADKITINSQGYVDGLLVDYMNYYEEDWGTIAPYLCGYIEWIGEDDCVSNSDF